MPKPSSPTVPEPATKPRAPLWPLRRVVALVAFLLFGPIIAFHVWDRIEGARFWRHIEAIERRGEPLKPGPRRPVTAEQKAASRHYGEALRLAATSSSKVFQDAGTLIDELSALAPSAAARDPRLEDLRRVEEPYIRALEALDRATPLDANGLSEEDVPPGFGGDQWIASANGVRIARLAFAGDGDRAAAALLATLRVRRVIPSYYASFALRTIHSLQLVLTFTTPPVDRLAALQREYAQIAETRPEHRLMADRAQFLAATIPGEFGADGYVQAVTPAEALAGLLLRPVWTNRLVASLEDYEDAIATASHPWPYKLDATRALAQRYRTSAPQGASRRSFLQRVVGPWRRRFASQRAASVTEAAAHSVARAGAAAAALAIARYRRAHRGALPATLADLQPTYGPAPAPDPFTGAELRYLRDRAGYKVYSVGDDRKDAGGRFELGSDLLPPRRGSSEDIGLAVTGTPRELRAPR